MRASGLIVVVSLAGCTLDPLVSDEIDLSRVFGDPAIEPGSALHVEDDPSLAGSVASFPGAVPYLRGYSQGQRIWYWRIDEVVPDFIVPYYILIFADGMEQRPIIDVIPGDGGYSPWWRRVEVRTTASYNGERIWSRAAIDAGVKKGILMPPEDTTTIVTAPVILRDARIQVDPMGTVVEPTWAWYRNKRVSWVIFHESDIEVPVDVRRFPRLPVYVFRRANQAFPLFEHAINLDLDGDGKLISSNNVFPVYNGQPGYTPMWYPIAVRTVEDYVSIDTATASVAVQLTGESQFVGADYNVVISPLVIPPLEPQRDFTELCPIQKTQGSL